MPFKKANETGGTEDPNVLSSELGLSRELYSTVRKNLPATEYSFTEQVKAGFRQENLIGSFLNKGNLQREFDRTYQGTDEEFDPLDGNYLDGYWDIADRFYDVTTRDEAEFIKYQIKRELQDREAAGIIGTGLGAILDPINFIPVLGWAGKSARGAAWVNRMTNASAFATVSAVQEVGLHATQETRTLSESLFQTAFAFGIGSLFKGARVKDPKALKESTDDLLDRLYLEGEIGGDAGAAKTKPDKTAADYQQTGGEAVNKVRPSLKARINGASSTSAREAGERILIQDTITEGVVKGKPAEQSLEAALESHKGILAGIHQTFAKLSTKIWWKQVKQKFSGGGEWISHSTIMKRVTAVARTGVDDILPEITEMGKLMRKTLDNYSERLQKASLIGDEAAAPVLEDYVNRIILKDIVNANRDDLIKLIRDDILRANPKNIEAEMWAENIVENMLGGSRGRTPIPSQIRKAMPRALHERVLDELLANPKYAMYFEQRADVLLENYIRGVGSQIELRALNFRGGSIVDDMLPAINQEYDDLIRAASKDGNEKLTKKLANERTRMIDNLYHAEDRVMGKMNAGKRDNLGFRTARYVKQMNFLSMLGGILPTSFADVAKPIMEFGVGRTFRTVAGRFRNIGNKEFKKMSKKNLNRFNVYVDLANSQRARLLYDLDDVASHSDWVGLGFEKMSNFMMGIPTGFFNHWNAYWKSISAHAAVDEIIELSLKVAKGKATKRNLADLADYGIDADVAKQIAKESSTTLTRHKGVNLVDTSTWTNVNARRRFEQAVTKRITQTIVTPTAGDAPKFFDNNPIWSVIFQFKSFPIASVDKTLVRGTQRAAKMGKGPQVLGGLTVAVAVGAVTNEIKAALAGRETPDADSIEYFYQAFDRSGMIPFLELYNIANTVSGNRLGRATGLESSRKAFQSGFGSLLGPTASQLERKVYPIMLDLLSGEGDEDTLKKAGSLLPFQNSLIKESMELLFELKDLTD